MYKTLKSDKLDIRNSPLDQLARLSARLILCAKGICDQAQPVGVAMGIMLGVDTALEKADQKAIFGPVLGYALKSVIPSSELYVKVSDLIREPVSQIENINQNINDIDSIIKSVSSWSSTDKDMAKDVNDIISELNKQKVEISKDSKGLRDEINKLLKSNPFNTKK